MKLFDKYKVIVFDLDDTLYPELAYLKLAYCHIASSVSNENKRKSKTDIYQFLLNEFLEHGRNELFQKLSLRFNLVNYELDKFLDDLRSVKIEKNSIQLFPVMEKLLLNIIEKDKRVYILTNGHPGQQMNKFYSINFPFRDFLNIIYASQNDRIYEKPNPYYIFEIIRRNKITSEEIIFIGDSPIDEQTAISAGIRFLSTVELKNSYLSKEN